MRRLFAASAVLFLLLLPGFAAAQTRAVSGTVTDSKTGQPLAGVTVSITGRSVATLTDTAGAYRIFIGNTVNALEFSSIGYAMQTVKVTGGVLDVALVPEIANLENVVVIGYGTAKKKDLTGSVALLTSKDFNKGQATTPEQLIAGKVAGVQITSNSGAPGSGSTIRIRGGASLNASNDPLIVIDGVPLSNDGLSGSPNPLSLINPNDIESFSILKDASAAAIYGSRASNGVILIVTKKGKRGKPVINFNTQFSVSKLPGYADVLSPGEFRNYVQTHGDAGQIALMGNATTNWQKEIYRTGIGSDNNLSISGAAANGKLPYRISAGYLKQQGVLKTSDLERKSAGINLSPSLLDDHLKIDINVKAARTDSRFANTDAIAAAVNFDPTQPVYSGSNRYNGYYEWLDPASVSGLRSLAPRNPLGLLMDYQNKGVNLRSIGNIQFDYKFHFLPELRANLNLGYDVAHGYGTIFVNDSAAQKYGNVVEEKQHNGQSDKYASWRDNGLVEFYLNYTKLFSRHKVDLTAGYGYYDFVTRNINFASYDAGGDLIPKTTPNFPLDKPRYTMISYYGRLNYSFNDRYLLTAALRTDGSSKFNPDNRWGLFPSAAFAWKIKEEPFLKTSSTVSDLKLRLGYGVTGQQDGIGNFDYISYYNLSSGTATYQLGDQYYQMYRPGGYYYERKWEQTTTYNAGLDYGFINNRIYGSIDVYYKKTTDLLNEINQPAGTNFTNRIVANIGSMENKGVEFLLNFVPVQNQDLSWTVNFNATYNRNKITRLTVVDDPAYAGAPTGSITGGVGNLIQIHSVQYPRSSFYVLQQVYDAAGKPVEGVFVDRNNDGLINENDYYRYKNPDPRYFLGLGSSVNYRKFSAGFSARANIGNYAYNNVISATALGTNILNPLGYLNNGSGDILFTDFSGGGDKLIFSDYYIENASFLRMDNIYLGYDFGKIFANTGNLRVNLSAQNVFVITRYKGLDPEVPGGVDNNFYPRPRVFALGLNLDF
ncbi:SusC/RagA family TonB-linked outer membrane protein [Niabella aurantiaca]|uniref:SusC/RagA family TonB-linked outer membrane protein n=1 Tax=Niabella aurantiaca TaxID=379900 RepID=UPI001FDFF94F|nr:TonB-dependent receptor [Niabella aurantiaca]